MLNIGDRYTKNGFTVIVHDISGGLVYCEKRLSHNSGKEWPQDDECDGNYGLYKMPITEFKKQINSISPPSRHSEILPSIG